MTSLVFLGYAIGHLVLFAWVLVLLLRHRNASSVPLLIVTFGLVYDNVLLAAGSGIGHGALLERLSVPRFFMHAFGTPLLMLSALGLARRSGSSWAQGHAAAIAVSLLTVGMVAVGVNADLIGLDLSAKTIDGVVSYGNTAHAGPPIAPIVTIFVLLVAGASVWKQGGGPWMFAGSAIQFAAAAAGDAIVLAGNFGELALLAGLVVTEQRLSQAASRG